ncbi:hypothetical protein RHGRI_029641 [Rhododendron griersonianum]|uniref:Uncharacterized protein n=1 Tax=Rhododendron griersonianum TaxID=479676 RepID=A0AAV6IR77_9ERIC|nr:hypothetical protein RHGRI_029641 [Rhododendron griersonianum]
MEPLSFKFAYCEVEVGGIWDTMVSGVLHMHGSSWALGHTLGAEYLDNCFEEISGTIICSKRRMNNSSRTKLRLSKKLRHLNPKPVHDLAFLYVQLRENGAHVH